MAMRPLINALLVLLFLSAVEAASSVSPPAAPPLPLSLNDRPIIGGRQSSLDGLWTLSSRAFVFPEGGRVPGDLVSDLVECGLLPEPLFENNFLLNASLWNDESWTYSRNVTLSAGQLRRLHADDAQGDVWLVFDGIKMGASIVMNGAQLAVSRNQFLRQELSLRSLIRTAGLRLHEGDNELHVTFDPDIAEYGQFMAASGGWDWAPVSLSKTRQSKLAAYTRGIWKAVYLLDVDWLAITHMTAHTRYLGAYPTAPLQAGRHGDFALDVELQLYAPTAVAIAVDIRGDWSGGSPVQVACQLPAGNSSCSGSLTVQADQIELWWPNGRGTQSLYNVTATAVSSDAQQSLSTWRRVGFRVFHLVTGNDTDPQWVSAHAEDNGSERMGLRYRVNGEAVFSRGANLIPIDELEGRYRAETLQRVVLSARDAGMNILRVWAGGIWQNDAFFDAADEAGVMIYHDHVNRGSFSGRPEEVAAYLYQLRRISSHPALVAFSLCNECFPWAGGGIVPQLATLVARTDPSRPLWPACPAQGWTSGVNRLTGLPNGRPLAMYSASTWGPLDTHGPYQHGDGFPAVNGNPDSLNLFDPMTPPHFDPSARIGLQYNHTFTSELGAVTWSSFESLSATFAPEHWSLHGGAPADNCTYGFLGGNNCTGNNVIAQRNYPCDSIVITYWGGARDQLDAVGRDALMAQLFHCLTGSALLVKGYIEQHRASNTFGLMLWQLNEIWPTGGWGSLEYGNGRFPGQVEGGRWKPTHYWLLHALYTDVIVSCGAPVQAQSDDDLLCYVKLDAYQPGISKYTVVVEQYELADSRQVRRLELPVALPPGPGSIHWFRLNSTWSSSSSLLELRVLSAAAQQPLTSNFFLSSRPDQLQLTAGSLGVTVTVGEPGVSGDVAISIRKDSDAVALFFTLTTLAAGRFSHNCFQLRARETTVTFSPFGPLNHTLLAQSLRWEHANFYTQQPTLKHRPVKQQLD